MVTHFLSAPGFLRRLTCLLGLFAIYRIGSFVPTPGIDAEWLSMFVAQSSGNQLLDLLSGGNFGRMTILALGIAPYITSRGLAQLLRRQGRFARYAAIAFALLQSTFIAFGLSRSGVIVIPAWQFIPITMLTLTAGAVVLMLLSDQITARGIGDGMSMIILAGIAADLPNAVERVAAREWGPVQVIVPVAVSILLAMFTARLAWGRRHIPVDRGAALSFSVNPGGMMPVFITLSVLAFVELFTQTGDSRILSWIRQNAGPGDLVHYVLYCGGIVFFCWLSGPRTIQPKQIAENLLSADRSVPGIRPGRQTAEYLNGVLWRLFMGGAAYLMALALAASFLDNGLRLGTVPLIGAWLDRSVLVPTFNYYISKLPLSFGATPLWVVLGATMDAIRMEPQQETLEGR